MEAIGMSGAIVLARYARFAAKLSVQIEPVEHVAQLQERPTVRIEPRSIRAAAFGPN